MKLFKSIENIIDVFCKKFMRLFYKNRSNRQVYQYFDEDSV